MNKKGPIIIIEDDADDQFLLTEAFKKLDYKYTLVFFSDGNEAITYLNRNEVTPFLILSDVNMPKINGFELREKVHTNALLQLKCIPYLFFTTNADKKSVIDAYSMSVQGFFVKPSGFNQLEKTIKTITDYWNECIAPNEYE
jgi:CheY-like chemotaxis protein